ncbi:MAG: hypothetical protein ACD_9C00158G0002 [uncultured bacterium]|nr:MAG: hypothetical protein ACD_9C00158G0002 [uncultured bacterium]
MDYNLFLMPLLVSFVTAASLLIAFILLGKNRMFRDGRIADRHIHKKNILRFGGVALVVAFVAAIFLNKQLVVNVPLVGVLIASLAIMIFGVMDDVRQLSWKYQLLFQIIIALFVWSVGIRLQYVTNPFGGIFLFENFFWHSIALFFSVAWIVFIMNAMNWIDGIDGVSGGVAFIAAVTIFLLSLRPEVNQPPVGIITAAFLGALAAFLLFNFNPAKILAGTSGSMFMGFVLAIMAIFAGAKIATTLLVLAVPIIDAFWVIGERIRAKVSIFSPDKRHLHFSFLEMGWSQKKICFFYYGITVPIAFVALNTNAQGKIFAFSIIFMFMIAIYISIRKRIKINA